MLVEKPSFCIKKENGEALRKLLLHFSLLDTDFKIFEKEGNLHFPLKRKPNEHEVSIVQELFGITPSTSTFQLAKKRLSLTDALKNTIPPEKLALLPRSFDSIGDIAILELPKELNAYKYEIARVFHLLHPYFSTVLAKKSAISGTTRVREYDFLSGVNKTQTVHIEYGCRIAVDLAKAYFSPRLLEEHNRIASLVQDGETVLDMFTGVGPFALHIARRHKAQVIAIDINPAAIELLQKSMTLNRLRGTIIPVVADAHEYVQKHFHNNIDRVIMNHPTEASNFVKDACFAIRSNGIIHYYDFINGSHPEKKIATKITKLIKETGMTVKSISLVRRVRSSAPYEFQMVADVIVSK